jgi:hypothetical protein
MPLHPSLIASYCEKCLSFVAASPRPSVLQSAERAHVCEAATNYKASIKISKPVK